MANGNGTNPLAPLARLVGGRWVYISGSMEKPPLAYHTYEWGAGQTAIHSRSLTEGGDVMVEGLWYWHPHDQAIKAIALGPMMGHSLFQYERLDFDGDRLTTVMHTFSPEGQNTFSETWDFSGDAYDWTLYAVTPEGKQPISNAHFERQAG